MAIRHPCFATGTLIATSNGDRTVETLAAGDYARLADGVLGRMIWIGHRRQQDAEVIRIRRHALGRQAPSRDLILSADHGIFLDGLLVQAGLLVNEETILSEHRNEVVFWHVELARHGLLLAEGAAAESYLDTGDRREFGNCPTDYDPVNNAASHEPCAEMVLAGTRLDALRTRLASRAWEAWDAPGLRALDGAVSRSF